jgi:hypothetical protein
LYIKLLLVVTVYPIVAGAVQLASQPDRPKALPPVLHFVTEAWPEYPFPVSQSADTSNPVNVRMFGVTVYPGVTDVVQLASQPVRKYSDPAQAQATAVATPEKPLPVSHVIPETSKALIVLLVSTLLVRVYPIDVDGVEHNASQPETV